MKTFLVTAVAGCMLLHPVVMAAQAVPPVFCPTRPSIQARSSADAPLMSAVRRDSGRLLTWTAASPRRPAPAAPARHDRRWIGRHPALFGALAGWIVGMARK